MDTVCGTVSDLGEEFKFLAQARREEKLSKEKEAATEEILWDWQVTTLLLAVIACLLFFIFAAIVSINYARQWKRMEKHFDAGRWRCLK
jgi:heme/copper-type cytochrome/quinol oxidase subunit 2